VESQRGTGGGGCGAEKGKEEHAKRDGRKEGGRGDDDNKQSPGENNTSWIQRDR
jgi:hypothetical protein